jgi:uncharacterized OsmC-like protein
MKVNRVDLEKFSHTLKEAEKDSVSAKKTMKIAGRWRLGESGPQFESELQFEGGKTTFYADEPSFLGGGGTAPNPVQYCIMGAVACFAATFAKWAAMEGITLDELAISADAHMDMSRSFGLSDSPILDKITFNIAVKTEANDEEIDKLLQITKERCPAYYCLTERITPEIKLSKE